MTYRSPSKKEYYSSIITCVVSESGINIFSTVDSFDIPLFELSMCDPLVNQLSILYHRFGVSMPKSRSGILTEIMGENCFKNRAPLPQTSYTSRPGWETHFLFVSRNFSLQNKENEQKTVSGIRKSSKAKKTPRIEFFKPFSPIWISTLFYF